MYLLYLGEMTHDTKIKCTGSVELKAKICQTCSNSHYSLGLQTFFEHLAF